MSKTGKTVLQIICAIIAGLVSVLLAHTYSFAQEHQPDEYTCSHLDYEEYRRRLKSEPLEGSPQEFLALAEDYLERCNARPEAARVALQAGRNALDTGDATRALEHYDFARRHYAAFQLQDRMDYITSLILNGQADLAWSLRDEEIDLWLETLEADGLADIETIRLRDGVVHKVTYDAVNPDRREETAWLIAPFGSGFPATISLSSDRALVALLKIRAGKEANGLKQLKLRRCHGQDTLISKIDGISDAAAHSVALTAAKAYLLAPDRVQATDPGSPIASCYHLDRLFIAPDPETAETLY